MTRISTFLTCACVLVLACKDEASTGTVPSATASVATAHSAAPSPSSSAAPSHTAAMLPPPPRLTGCTFLAIAGDVKTTPDGGVPRVPDTANDAMITFAADAKLTVRDRVSGRESTLLGAGSAKLCVGGDSEHWLFGGTLTSNAFTGATPGSGDWIVVPGAIVRISSSTARVKVTGDRTEVAVVSGSATIFPVGAILADGGAPDAEGWWHVPSGATWSFSAPPAHKAELVVSCDKQASLARDLAGQLAMADAGIGDLAPKHMAARERARALCAVARFSALGDKALGPRADAADARWRVVVTPP
jgi:hypothetical protein